MSATLSTPPPITVIRDPERKPSRIWRILLVWALVLVALALAAWAGIILYTRSFSNSQTQVPVVPVSKGDVSLSVFAIGEIRGGNSQVLTAPMTGGTSLHMRFLSPNGAPVKAGDVVVVFDTTDQEFALKEAESDLAEAEQHIQQAKAQLQADAEEDRYALLKAHSDLELAELEARKNPILPSITAKQNDLAVAVARDRLSQLEHDSANKKDSGEAGIAIQQAASSKAQAKVLTARQNIQAMTLHAERNGYVSARKNSNLNFIYSGMDLPIFQVGDEVRPGMAVAEIPDLNHWEVEANIGELDRGHLTLGDKVNLDAIALPHHTFHGHITDIGGTSGSPWNRHFACKIALDDQAPGLRPGMTARVEITTETLRNALWIPAQALFEADGKVFVYLRSGKTFTRKDVTLVRRNETRVVLTGLQAGQEVALANPTDAAAPKKKSVGGPMEAIPK